MVYHSVLLSTRSTSKNGIYSLLSTSYQQHFISGENFSNERRSFYCNYRIFSEAEKLNQIQNNDKNKFHLCITHKINLCILDVSSLSYFKEQKAQKYLDIITTILNKELKNKSP